MHGIPRLRSGQISRPYGSVAEVSRRNIPRACSLALQWRGEYLEHAEREPSPLAKARPQASSLAWTFSWALAWAAGASRNSQRAQDLLRAGYCGAGCRGAAGTSGVAGREIFATFPGRGGEQVSIECRSGSSHSHRSLAARCSALAGSIRASCRDRRSIRGGNGR